LQVTLAEFTEADNISGSVTGREPVILDGSGVVASVIDHEYAVPAVMPVNTPV
jgi:hypothetical protein